MASDQSRRRFLKHCAEFGGVCCALLAWNRRLPAADGAQDQTGQGKKPLDLKQLAYCGIPYAYCERQCELFRATRDNDAKLKRAVYDQWEMKKKFGVEFSPEKIFCFGCKPGDKPLKVGMAECPVRACPIANGFESCVQCLNLASCDKAFWTDWPIAFASAKRLQERYKGQPGAALKAAVKK